MGAPFLPRGDIENNAARPWRDPADGETNAAPERTEGLTELFDAAIRRAAELLVCASKYFDGEMGDEAFAKAVGSVGYDTGKTSLA